MSMMQLSQVKIVIWDLDDTFWQGTLSEESVLRLDRNIQLVRDLAECGIISSICSRNDYSLAKSKLTEMGVWEYFVRPTIEWSTKGNHIQSLIKDLNLRAENAVFLDDNPTNRGEVEFHLPGTKCFPSADEFIQSLGGEEVLSIKVDPELKRLRQYHDLANRVTGRDSSTLSNEEFLRQSQIVVEIDYDVEPHLERIVELLNRANQLNFTKRRISDHQEKKQLENQLTSFGFKAGVVKVRDVYSDYGVVGFFMTLSTLREYSYVHFVFSCRIMNMGVEQYVHELLNRPQLQIQHPVANGLDEFSKVDWISESSNQQTLEPLRANKALLLGGCDMLQLASYCSSVSAEFTNRLKGNWIYRFDDPNFLTANREMVAASPIRSKIPAWNSEEVADFETHLSTSDIIIISIYEMMTVTYFRGTDGMIVRFHEDTLKDLLRSDLAIWFVRNFSHVYYTFEERLRLVELSIATLIRRAKENALVVVITENTRKMDHNLDEAGRRTRYNDFLFDLATKHDKFAVVDVNKATNSDWLIDGWHMTRQAYFELAQEIMRTVTQKGRDNALLSAITDGLFNPDLQ